MRQIFFLVLLFPMITLAQHTYIEPNSDLSRLADRLEIMGKSNVHAAVNQFSSRALFSDVIKQYDSLSFVDQYLAAKLVRTYPEFWDMIPHDQENDREFIDSTNTFYEAKATSDNQLEEVIAPRKPVLKYFYANRNHFAQIKAKGFLLKINPVLFFGVGRDVNQGNYVFENRRGITLSGHINEKIYFYTDILESQAAFPSYVKNFINRFRSLPGNGLYKRYDSVILGDNAGYDFLNARAYINARITKGIGVEFGNGKHFIGNGNRSLLLSDFSNNYLYLKANTNIWKIHYQNIWAELIPLSPLDNPSGTVIARKYSATHYLSFKHRGLELGIFESVIFERDGRYDLQYLNPVILYRLVEYNLDSSDNVLVGANGKFNFMNRFQLYGQLLLDEFKLDELFIERNGWWANKYGIQAGAKYINAFGVDQLDLQIEYNRVRPFTYGHRSQANYTHMNQALAHPLGANFEEVNFSISYYVNPKLSLSSTNYFIRQGLDSDSIYYGENILRPSGDRISQRGHFFLQGEASSRLLSVNKISYEFFPNYFLDLNLTYRSQSSAVDRLDFDNVLFSGMIRINFWEPSMHF